MLSAIVCTFRASFAKAEITATDPRTVVTDKNLAIAREELAKIANEDFKNLTN